VSAGEPDAPVSSSQARGGQDDEGSHQAWGRQPAAPAVKKRRTSRRGAVGEFSSTHIKEAFMTSDSRSAFQQQVVEALVKNKAINLEVMGTVLSKFGEEALLRGESLSFILTRHVFLACGNPGPLLDRLPAAQLGSE
jgi:hypothetical protein